MLRQLAQKPKAFRSSSASSWPGAVLEAAFYLKGQDARVVRRRDPLHDTSTKLQRYSSSP